VVDADYNTIRYHLDKLADHDVVESGGEEYGQLCFLTDRFEAHRDAFEGCPRCSSSPSSRSPG
jgi:hypothetical protein